MPAEPIDVVYTWVDDAFPGYRELLNRYADKKHDLNPNRTRDNLDMLKYSLRSLERFAPWVGRVFLVSCRPQVPPWLDPDAPGLTLVHHDQFMDEAHLPTFSSFAIVSNLHRLPGVSRRFLYVEDDFLLGQPVHRRDFLTPAGRPIFRVKRERSPGAAGRDAEASPWNLALAHSDYLLDRRYRPEPRRMIAHAPYVLDVELFRRMIDLWPDDFRRTSASRFRSRHNVASEHLYPYHLWYEGRAVRLPLLRSYADSYYQGIDNVIPQQLAQFAFLRWRRPKLYCLNDNFGDRPNPFVVRLARRYLERAYPHPSRFERS